MAFAGVIARARELRRSRKDQQEFLERAADMGADRLNCYTRVEDYYCGKHRVQLTDRERQYLEASGLPYAENFCETIVDIHSSRLLLRTFGSEDKALAQFANDLWDANQLDDGQTRIHEGYLKYGDYFAIVEPEEGRLPCVYPHSPTNVKMVYDAGEPLYAVKVWTTSQASPENPQGQPIRRMNIYWPDVIQKWFTSASDDAAWGPWTEDGDEGNDTFWTMDGTPDGEPIGIPVIHFAHKPNPHYGRSILRSVIPQQDALNKSLIDLFWVMDAQGWPQQWGSGFKAENLIRHPGSLWTVDDPAAQFGQFDAADPEKAIYAIESQLKRMASRSFSPLHLMLAGGNLPSGETLKTSESGLTRVSWRRIANLNDRYRDTTRVAARVENAFGDTAPPLEGKLNPIWERPESRQEVEEANTAVLWQTLGVSQDTILSRLGFDPEEERRKRTADDSAGIAAGLLDTARKMQAPTPSAALGGGTQPAQNPANARVTP